MFMCVTMSMLRKSARASDRHMRKNCIPKSGMAYAAARNSTKTLDSAMRLLSLMAMLMTVATK